MNKVKVIILSIVAISCFSSAYAGDFWYDIRKAGYRDGYADAQSHIYKHGGSSWTVHCSNVKIDEERMTRSLNRALSKHQKAYNAEVMDVYISSWLIGCNDGLGSKKEKY